MPEVSQTFLIVFDRGQLLVDTLVEFGRVVGSEIAQLAVLEPTPNRFGRVEHRSIRRQLLQTQAGSELFDLGANRIPFVHRSTVPDDYHSVWNLAHQPLQKARRMMVIEIVVDHHSASFLERLMREIPNRMVVIWDGGPMHKGDPIRAQVEKFRPRLSLEKLPPYAPMLNPTEPIWSWLKYSQLCNFAPHDASELNKRVHEELTTIEDDQECLRNFWHGSDLPFPRTLLL